MSWFCAKAHKNDLHGRIGRRSQYPSGRCQIYPQWHHSDAIQTRDYAGSERRRLRSCGDCSAHEYCPGDLDSRLAAPSAAQFMVEMEVAQSD